MGREKERKKEKVELLGELEKDEKDEFFEKRILPFKITVI